jgi:phage-related protein
VGSAKKDMQRMPDDVQDVFGFALHELQHGDTPEGARRFGEGLNSKIWKLATDAEDTNTYRMAYTAVFPEVVYVLDVFTKKSKSGTQTPKADRDRVARRFRTAEADYHQNFGVRK